MAKVILKVLQQGMREENSSKVRLTNKISMQRNQKKWKNSSQISTRNNMSFLKTIANIIFSKECLTLPIGTGGLTTPITM